MAFYTTPPLTEKSGTTQIAATAEFNLNYAPVGRVLVADGYGNVTDSGVLLSSLGDGPISFSEILGRLSASQLPPVVDIGIF
jgi:hypothetical protein